MTANVSHADGFAPPFLDGGEAGKLVRSIDWAGTVLGPVDNWPTSLQTIVGTVLHSRHPMFLWWGADLIQFYNDAYLPSFGLGKHPTAMGQRGAECWQEIWPIIWPQIDDVMQRGKASWNEDQLVPIFRNGKIEEVYWTYGYSPVFDDEGKIGGTLVVCTETTARVLTERRLRVMQLVAERNACAEDHAALSRGTVELLEAAQADVPWAAICQWDEESHALEIVESTGLSTNLRARVEINCNRWFASRNQQDDSCHINVADYHAETASSIDMPMSNFYAESSTEFSTEAFAVPIEANGSVKGRGLMVFGLNPKLPFDDAYRNYLQQLANDLSKAHARLESVNVRAMVESERNNLLMQAPVATAVLTGPDHVFRLTNPLYCQVVGRENIVGKTYLEAFPELVETPLPGILDKVYRTGEPFVTNEYLVPLARNGRDIEDCFFRFNLEPMRDTASHVYGMMVVAVDITDQVRARHALERSHTEREKLLAELESASRAKDEFLAMLGHELRNPLAPIVSALQLMKIRGDTGTAKEQGIIQRQVEHLIRLVDDLLDISKITTGKIELRKGWVEVADVLAKAVEMVSVLFEQRKHRLTVDVPKKLLWEGDAVRLAQVVANLLTNAARYTDPGGIIHLKAWGSDNEIAISVKDNGRGISAELLPIIFDLFIQGGRSVDRAEGGLGLGLALVKSLVEMHGGQVVALSEGREKGSEFVISLPVLPPVFSQAAGMPSPTAPALRPVFSKRVLLVDDNVDAADALSQILKVSGYEPKVFNDPVTALNSLQDFAPDIAILDIGLPVMDGYELAVELRTRLEGSVCRLIALTGYGQQADRSRSERVGFEAHLVKPVDIDKLLRLIAESPQINTIANEH